MAIAADHRNLSPAAPVDDGGWGARIAQAWAEANVSTYRPQADEATPFRASMAGKCAREVGYYAADVPASDPMDLAGTWNTSLGTKIHTWWDEAMVSAAANAGAEMRFEAGYSIDGLLSGRTDVVVGDEALELKTIGGYKFKKIVGARGGAPGPVPAHKLQLALAVHGLGLARGTLVYLSKECMSDAELTKLLRHEPGEDEQWRKFVVAFRFDADELVPLAEEELRRLGWVAKVLASGRLPARAVPELGPGSRVVDPATGRWEARVVDEDTGEQVVSAAGTAWQCSYCNYQTRCGEDLAAGDPTPVELSEKEAS